MTARSGKVLAFGASGPIAGLALAELARRGADVRAFVRRDDQREQALARGASEVAIGDLADARSVGEALAGVDAVFYVAPVDLPDQAAIGRRVVAQAVEAGVRRFVFSSVIHPVLSLPNHAAKGPVEEALIDSGLAFAILHPALLYQNFAAAWPDITEKRILAEPWSNETRHSRVDYRDVAEVAALALLAAGMAGLIWRIDLADDGSASARVWLRHDSMRNRPGEKKPEQPGTNGVQFDPTTGHVYYTTTSQQMMLRVKVDPGTLDPADLPEFVAGGRQWDDFLIDPAAGVAYVTTHRENTIDRVRLAHDGNREGRTVIAGEPFDAMLVGPSAGAWGRAPGDAGRIAYVTTNGGTAQPPDGRYRTAKVMRVELPKTT